MIIEALERWKPLHAVGGKIKWCSPTVSVWTDLLSNLNLRPVFPSTSPIYMYSEELKTCPYKNLSMNSHCSILHNTQQIENKLASISKVDIHFVECYLDIKRNEVLLYAPTGMNAENRLSERSQNLVVTCHLTPFV